MVKGAESSSLSEPKPLAYTHDQPKKHQNMMKGTESSSLSEPRPLAYTHDQPKNNFTI
jgi:hypothetical protein